MTTATQPNEVTASVDAWLSAFGDALAANDPARAAALFTEDGFWRDLVAFTWNLKTLEGRAEISDMLTATLAHVQPTGWKITGGLEPAEAGGITEAWIDFETAAGRGHGHLRLRGGQAWTLLTTLYELKGYEEPKGRPARRAPSTASTAAGPAGRRSVSTRRRSWASPSSRTCSSSVAGRPGSAWPRGCGSSACPRSSSTSAPVPVTSGAAGTRASACMIRSGTTTCPT